MKKLRHRNHLPVSATAQRSKRRLQAVLCLFFIGLAVPAAYLIFQVYSQFDRENLYQYRQLAENLVNRIDQRITTILSKEEQRSFAEYSFFNVEENPLIKSTAVAFSPLSQYPPSSSVPGIVGYFQVNPKNRFGSPLLPELNYRSSDSRFAQFSDTEFKNRLQLQEKIKNILLSSEAQQFEESGNEMQVTEDEKPAASIQQPISAEYRTNSPVLAQRLSKSLLDRIFEDDTASQQSAESLGFASEQQKSAVIPGLSARHTGSNYSADKELKKTEEAEKNLQVRRLIKKKAKLSSRVRRKEQVQIPDQAAASTFYNTPSQSVQLKRDQKKDQVKVRERQVVAAANRTAERAGRVVEKENASGNKIPVSILRFESEIDPLKMFLIGDSYFCFYRNVWQRNGRYIQGFLVNRIQFLKESAGRVLEGSQIGNTAKLFALYKGTVLEQLNNTLAAKPLLKIESKKPIFRAFADAPMNDIEYVVSLGEFPGNPGERLVDGLVVILAVVLSGGLLGLYRLGTKQIELADQQANFVSAVSHELKTPLTSIRMYSEMLRAGWVSDQPKKKSYYDFIFFESERLSRLIENILELSRISHKNSLLTLNPCGAETLLSMIKEKALVQVEAAGFELKVTEPRPGAGEVEIDVDKDAFSQIFINLVDNALKFAADAANPTVEIGCRVDQGESGWCGFFVRDFGPGIQKAAKNKVFKLFYRSETEMTRTKPGSGIGLSLVKQFALRMNAQIELINREPGLEVLLKFPRA